MNPEPILILLVEDDPAHVTAIQRAFEASGSEFKIKVVGTLREFRHSIADQLPAIAVVDLNLPDGRAAEVLTQPPEAGPFPVLVMTSYGNEQVAVTAIKAGALDYVVKSPEAFADIPHTITRVLHEWNLLQERKRAEAALEFKNIILSTQQETSIDGILVVDENGEIISFNRRFIDLWGVPFAVVESKSDEQVLQSVMDKMANPEEFTGELEHLNEDRDETSRNEIALKDGRTFDRYSAPMLGADGKYYGRVWYFRDITERKRVEDSLRRSEEMLKRSQHVARLGHYALDAVSGDWVSSETLDDVFGIDAAFKRNVAGWSKLIHPEDRDVMLAYLQNHVLKGRNPFDEEYRIVRANDGGIRWVHGLGELRFNASGDVMEMFGTIQDITERKQAEQTMQMFRYSIDQASHAVFWMNRDGGFSYVNDQACVSLGYTREELLRLHLWDIDPVFPKELWFSRWEGYQTNRQDGKQHLESLHRRKDGSTFPVEVISRHLWLGGEELHVAFVQDMTEKKNLEAQLLRTQRLESVGRLASGIAHDLNNILAPMLMAPPLLREAIQDPELRSLLDLIETNAQRGSDIIKQLLTFGRGLESERVPVQLRALVLDMAGIIRETFPKNITLRRETPPETWPVKGDATQLHQILMNLCVNARDAMPKGGLLTLKLENHELDESFARMTPGARPGRYVCLSVTDTGQGIAPEHLDKIYDPFFTTKEPDQGTGLGLATVLGIVQSHGGFIQVHSQHRHGTQFKAYLPASETAEGQPANQASQPIPQGHGELVLMVDDEESVRQVMRQLLECNGYRMIEAVTGTAGIVQYVAHQQEVQVVVTDLIMPVMDGPAFIRVLRRMNPQVRVIVMSGNQVESNLSADLGVPNEARLAKPFTGAMLLQTLQRVLHPEAPPKH